MAALDMESNWTFFSETHLPTTKMANTFFCDLRKFLGISFNMSSHFNTFTLLSESQSGFQFGLFHTQGRCFVISARGCWCFYRSVTLRQNFRRRLGFSFVNQMRCETLCVCVMFNAGPGFSLSGGATQDLTVGGSWLKAQSTQDAGRNACANWKVFPLMLLVCSVDTPIHINRSHLLVSHCVSHPASCVDWASVCPNDVPWVSEAMSCAPNSDLIPEATTRVPFPPHGVLSWGCTLTFLSENKTHKQGFGDKCLLHFLLLHFCNEYSSVDFQFIVILDQTCFFEDKIPSSPPRWLSHFFGIFEFLVLVILVHVFHLFLSYFLVARYIRAEISPEYSSARKWQ